jgi:HEPN domain-containing protein
MNSKALAKEYLERCKKRLKALELLYKERSYADVVREAQEIVELCGKGILRACGIDPPKWHDISDLIIDLAKRYKDFKEFEKDFKKYAKFSKWLRKERELSFYGEIDFLPSEEYKESDAKRAKEAAKFSIELLEKILSRKKSEKKE